MKIPFRQFGLQTALGIIVHENAVTISQVASTPFGFSKVACHHDTIAEGETLAEVLDRRLNTMFGRRGRHKIPVMLGLPTQQVFFTTRPIQSTSKNPPPEMLLREALYFSGNSIDAMATDVIQSRPGNRPVVSILSCEQKYLNGLLDQLSEVGLARIRVEPAPFALLRAAVPKTQTVAKRRVTVHVFLGDSQGLAMIAVDQMPILWRQFDLLRADEANSILSAVRSLQTLRSHCGVDADWTSVVLHGRSELEPLVEFEWMQQQFGVKAEWVSGPHFDDAEIAHGLAIGGLSQDEPLVNLSKSTQWSKSVWETFPWRTVAYQTLVLICMALFLFSHHEKQQAASRTVRQQNAKRDWLADVTESELKQERTKLEARIAAIKQFQETRVVWTNHTQHIVEHMPDNLSLTLLQGTAALPTSAKSKRKSSKAQTSFLINGEILNDEDGAMSNELDDFLRAVQASPELNQDFPVVELTGLRSLPVTAKNNEPMTSFTIVCQPKARTKTSKSSASGKKG